VKHDPSGVEFAELLLTANQPGATGVAIGTAPVPYRLDYTLRTRPGFLAARLQVAARGQGWRRSLDLRRTKAGAGIVLDYPGIAHRLSYLSSPRAPGKGTASTPG
jgi:hypothetical protein